MGKPTLPDRGKRGFLGRIIAVGMGAGVNIIDLGFPDPTRPEVRNVWIDWVSGGVVRQGFLASLEELAEARTASVFLWLFLRRMCRGSLPQSVAGMPWRHPGHPFQPGCWQ